MTKQQIQKHTGQFGEIEYNSSPCPGAFHGYIHEVKHSTITFRRLEGHPIHIKIAAIQSFVVKPDPKYKYSKDASKT